MYKNIGPNAHNSCDTIVGILKKGILSSSQKLQYGYHTTVLFDYKVKEDLYHFDTVLPIQKNVYYSFTYIICI